MIVDDPQTLAEVEAEFARYETALVTNDVEALDNFFWRDARAIRYGGGENLYGFDEIAAFRAGRSPAGGCRSRRPPVVTTHGRDTAPPSTLFTRAPAPRAPRRQMQTWVRMPEGWRIVAAHVSVIDDKPA